MNDLVNQSAVSMQHICKSFGKLKALNDVSLDVKYGEIHAVLGENGAGKSTLMSILFGMLKPDKGSIFINGEEVHMKDANDATKLKIGMVHQHFKLVNDFTVFENIILGCEDSKLGVLEKKEAYKKIQGICKKYGIFLSLDKKVRDISVGMQQRTEIVKVLYRNADILIFDEPTAVLTPQEIDAFIEILKNFKKENKAIILITHKLDEIKKSSDVCTILRRGQTIDTLLVKAASTNEMASLMVGRKVSFTVEKKEACPKETVLEVKNLSCGIKHSKRKALNNISLKVRSGEIVAIAGIEGNGQEELINLITGLESYPQTSGSIRFYDIGIKGNYHELTQEAYSALEKKIDECYDAAYHIKEQKRAKLDEFDLKIEEISGRIDSLSKKQKDEKKKLLRDLSDLKSKRKEYLSSALKAEKIQIKQLKEKEKPQYALLNKNYVLAKKQALPIFLNNVKDFSKKNELEKEEIEKNFIQSSTSLKKEIKALEQDYKKVYLSEKKEFECFFKAHKTSVKAKKDEFDALNENKAIQQKAKEIFQQSDSLKKQLDEKKKTLLSLERKYRDDLVENKNNLRYLKRSRYQKAYLDLLRCNIRTKRNHKLAIIPSDRIKQGLVSNFDIAMNLVVTKLSKKPFSRFGVLNGKIINENANTLIEKYDIRSSNGKDTRVGDMSGGNQQKVILARETYDTPRLLIANQPTRGLDVGAIEGINKLLIQKRDEGSGVLLYSVELEDIMNLADRILVIHNGHISAELDPKKTSFEEIGLYMGGNNNKEENNDDKNTDPQI